MPRWICYIGFVAICVGVRMAARAKYGIGGTAPEDLLSCLICYAGVAVQVIILLISFLHAIFSDCCGIL